MLSKKESWTLRRRSYNRYKPFIFLRIAHVSHHITQSRMGGVGEKSLGDGIRKKRLARLCWRPSEAQRGLTSPVALSAFSCKRMHDSRRQQMVDTPSRAYSITCVNVFTFTSVEILDISWDTSGACIDTFSGKERTKIVIGRKSPCVHRSIFLRAKMMFNCLTVSVHAALPCTYVHKAKFVFICSFFFMST